MVSPPSGSSQLSTGALCRTSRGRLITWVRPFLLAAGESVVIPKLNHVAPEYALDEALNTSSDLYSLGCLIYAVHCKGDPPFKTHGSLGGLRDAAGRPFAGINGLDRDLQGTNASPTTATARNPRVLSDAERTDHAKPHKSTHRILTTFTLVLLIIAYIYPQFPRQI